MKTENEIETVIRTPRYSESAHTPGPWYWERGNDYVHEESTGATVCRICEDDGHIASATQIPHEANARLIAAAPNLLAALESILQSAGYTSGKAEPTLRELNVSIAALNQAREAIARAKEG